MYDYDCAEFQQCGIPSNRLRNPTAHQMKLEMARQKRISYFNEILLKLFLIKLALSPTNTYINDFFACLTIRLGNPNPLRERQRETEIVLLGQQREALRETGAVFECKPHRILRWISAGVLDTVSTIIMG